jgi:acyl-CoA hydrolase/GNAT superfamily N-acetyltransferase
MTAPLPQPPTTADLARRWGLASDDPRLAACADRLAGPLEALEGVRSGDHVFIGTASATPRTLVAALERLSPWRNDLELLHFLSDGAVESDAQGLPRSRARHRCFFVGQELRAAVRACAADYVPVSAARLPALIASGRVPVDVALVQVSLPDADGHVSLGVSVDVIPAALARARLVIAELNPAMPYTRGDARVPLSRFHRLVPVDGPVTEYRHPATDDAAMQRIARYIAGVIEDGSTLQIGPGRYPQAALAHLDDRRDLGLHTDVLTDAVLSLVERGVLTGARKTRDPGRIVCSLAMGSRRLYDWIDGNPQVEFRTLDRVADPVEVAAQHRMVSVTQAFAIDLTGQVCADHEEGGFYGGLGAQAEFHAGAARAEGGKAIVCLSALTADGRGSRIRATLAPGQGASIACSDVHYVITEFGIAYLFGRSIRERALALIQLAHPDHRAALAEQARALGYIPAGQKLRNLRAYDIAREQRTGLADGRELLLRPALVTDADLVRDLFHRLPERDVFTRFFRKVKTLSLTDAQRLCNLDDGNEVSLVAVTGPREQPVLVAHAMYVLDPGTGLAETAFMVHPDWQGSGLGGRLQAALADVARTRGVAGFVAEVLAGNERMLKLARAAGGQVRVLEEAGVVRIVSRF